MIEDIKKFLTEFITALQTAKIYTSKHPKFRDFTEMAYNTLHGLLKKRPEIIIGIVEEDLAFEKEIFFDLSQKVKSLVLFLKDRGMERIVFKQSLQKEELAKFILFLINPNVRIQEDDQGNLSLPGIQNIKAGKIKTPGLTNKEDTKKTQSFMHEDTLEKLVLSLENVLNEDEVDYLDLRFNLQDFVVSFTEKYEEFLFLISIKRKDLITFLHLLTVSLLSTYFSSKIGFSKDDVLDIGIAALFHDIGKISISRKILKKKEKLAEEEFSKIMNHSILGTEILIRYTDTLGILPPVVAFEHHIRYDLKGYPHLTFPRQLHSASLIVSLCDVYDALTQRRIYKREFPPLKIYEIMKKERGGLFHPRLLDKFFSIMGVWPVGTIVTLSDGRIAVVREANENDIFCPKVEAVLPEDKREFIDLKNKKKLLKIDGSLNPFEEGKKYVHLI